MDTQSDPQRTAHELTQRWLELDNTIRQSNEMVRDVRSERNQIGENLIAFLRSQGYTKPSLRLGSDTVFVAETTRRPPITLDGVRAAMAATGMQEEVGVRVVGHIEEARSQASATTVALARRKSRQRGGSRTRRAAVRRSENQAEKQ